MIIAEQKPLVEIMELLCEVNPETPCAWQLIWERAAKLGKLDQLLKIQPAKDWSTSRDGGTRKIVRPDLSSLDKQQEDLTP